MPGQNVFREDLFGCLSKRFAFSCLIVLVESQSYNAAKELRPIDQDIVYNLIRVAVRDIGSNENFTNSGSIKFLIH